MSQIEVANLAKYYYVHQKEPGLAGSLRSFVRRKYTDVRAVDGITFAIEPGEIVGFLGPNGAGKTTTLKVLSGLLYPTSGRATVLGYVPHHRAKEYLKRITLVMGQKQQLIWDLPAMETFLVNQAVYEVESAQFATTLAELTEMLELAPLLKKQVRKLSLGERMKCELAAALLHRPQVLFLDEPTIGLDVNMQANVRQFVADYNRRYGATVILTSHYMADVTALCKRIIIIDKGKILYDGDLPALIARLSPYKVVKVTLAEPLADGRLAAYGQVQARSDLEAELLVPRESTSQVAARLLMDLPVADVTIQEPPIETIIGQIFTRGTVTNQTPKGLPDL
ncbi:MAG: ATP-binding cassette domain-containing protein [Anaerolineae bacterium]|nr:ATP-binding cassette domain-containing protein [Anaerolineae bacterium]